MQCPSRVRSRMMFRSGRYLFLTALKMRWTCADAMGRCSLCASPSRTSTSAFTAIRSFTISHRKLFDSRITLNETPRGVSPFADFTLTVEGWATILINFLVLSCISCEMVRGRAPRAARRTLSSVRHSGLFFAASSSMPVLNKIWSISQSCLPIKLRTHFFRFSTASLRHSPRPPSSSNARRHLTFLDSTSGNNVSWNAAVKSARAITLNVSP
mmetsp:Transcript_45236/g.72752  ORF Transcript_45236/g.72752 Transcript_45236/m.72752 type:complete len:213 (-) Transcript_45236:448-1086(-)